MPLLFALGQHGSLVAIQGRLRDNEHVLAYHDDVYTVCKPERVAHPVASWEDASVEQRGVGTRWDRSIARAVKPHVVVWRGDPLLPVHQQGLKVLGIPIGQLLLSSLTSRKQIQRTADPFPRGPRG